MRLDDTSETELWLRNSSYSSMAEKRQSEISRDQVSDVTCRHIRKHVTKLIKNSIFFLHSYNMSEEDEKGEKQRTEYQDKWVQPEVASSSWCNPWSINSSSSYQLSTRSRSQPIATSSAPARAPRTPKKNQQPPRDLSQLRKSPRLLAKSGGVTRTSKRTPSKKNAVPPTVPKDTFKQQLKAVIIKVLGDQKITTKDPLFRTCANKLSVICMALLKDSKSEVTPRQMYQVAKSQAKQVLQFVKPWSFPNRFVYVPLTVSDDGAKWERNDDLMAVVCVCIRFNFFTRVNKEKYIPRYMCVCVCKQSDKWNAVDAKRSPCYWWHAHPQLKGCPHCLSAQTDREFWNADIDWMGYWICLGESDSMEGKSFRYRWTSQIRIKRELFFFPPSHYIVGRFRSGTLQKIWFENLQRRRDSTNPQ